MIPFTRMTTKPPSNPFPWDQGIASARSTSILYILPYHLILIAVISLAYAEMQMILARVIWNFDIELVESSKSWMETLKVYGLWEKPPLMVKLAARQR
jgi:hypothetical protein